MCAIHVGVWCALGVMIVHVYVTCYMSLCPHPTFVLTPPVATLAGQIDYHTLVQMRNIDRIDCRALIRVIVTMATHRAAYVHA